MSASNFGSVSDRKCPKTLVGVAKLLEISGNTAQPRKEEGRKPRAEFAYEERGNLSGAKGPAAPAMSSGRAVAVAQAPTSSFRFFPNVVRTILDQGNPSADTEAALQTFHCD